MNSIVISGTVVERIDATERRLPQITLRVYNTEMRQVISMVAYGESTTRRVPAEAHTGATVVVEGRLTMVYWRRAATGRQVGELGIEVNRCRLYTAEDAVEERAALTRRRPTRAVPGHVAEIERLAEQLGLSDEELQSRLGGRLPSELTRVEAGEVLQGLAQEVTERKKVAALGSQVGKVVGDEAAPPDPQVVTWAEALLQAGANDDDLAAALQAVPDDLGVRQMVLEEARGREKRKKAAAWMDRMLAQLAAEPGEE